MLEKITAIILRKEIIYLLIYDILFFIINILSYYELKQKIKYKRGIVIFFIINYIIIGIFGKLGYDYYNYKFSVENSLKKEIFYNFLNVISMKNINFFYFYVLFLNTIFIYFLNKLLKTKYVLLYVSFLYNFYFLDSINILRSVQAQLLALIGITLYLKNKKIRGYLILLITIFFHKTAIINIFLILVKIVKKINLKKIILAVGIGIFLNNFIIRMSIQVFKNTKYLRYFESNITYNFSWFFLNYSVIFLKLIFIIYFLYLFQNNKVFYNKYKILIQGLVFGVLLYITILFTNVSPHIFQRLPIILLSFDLILLTKYLEFSKFRRKDICIYFGGAIIFFTLTNISILRFLYTRELLGI